MNALISLLLGLIQGLTEFLPISSSGHLVLFQRLMGVEVPIFFDLLLHVATLFSVVAVYRRELLALFKPPFTRLFYLASATVPACLALLLFRGAVEEMFSGSYLPYAFLITALTLFLSSKSAKRVNEYKEMDFKSALYIGFYQAIAVIPGISRSGMTVSAGLNANLRREEVASFSFLMSVPIICGSFLLSLFETGASAFEAVYLYGFFAALISGFFAVKLMKKLIERANLAAFSVYLVILAIFTFFVL